MSSDSSGFQTNHQDSLTGLCRICGERARRKYEKTIPKLCVDYKSDIIQVYRLNINGDDIDRHPTKICNRCYTVMKKALRTKDVNILDNASQRVTTDSFWSLHTEQSCSVCTHYVAQDKGGRPAKDRWLKKRQHDGSASFDPPGCSTPQKQSTLVTNAQTSPFQLKTLPILQDADATDLTERSDFVDCQTSPIKQLESKSISDTLGKGKEEPLSNLEEKLATSLLRRKQNSSADCVLYN